MGNELVILTGPVCLVHPDPHLPAINVHTFLSFFLQLPSNLAPNNLIFDLVALGNLHARVCRF